MSRSIWIAALALVVTVRTANATPHIDRASAKDAITLVNEQVSTDGTDRREMLEKVLSMYRALESKLGKNNDPAVALAAFVVGCASAYRNAAIPDEAIDGVLKQLEQMLSPSVIRSLGLNKVNVLEQVALAGMLMLVTQSSGTADVRSMRAMATHYAMDYLAVDLAAMTVGAAGVSWSGKPQGIWSANQQVTSTRRVPAVANTTQGKPFPLTTVHGILFSWSSGVGGMMQQGYILFKDGTYTTDIPRDLMNYDREERQRMRPRSWGKWRRKGKTYEVQHAGEWKIPSNATLFAGAKRGEKLSKKYTFAESSATLWTSSYFKSSIRFDAAGRFSTDVLNGTGMGGPSGDTYVRAHATNEYSASSIAGPDVGGGSVQRKQNANADHNGTYELDGLVLTLTYDNGTVAQHLFSAAADRKTILFAQRFHFVGTK